MLEGALSQAWWRIMVGLVKDWGGDRSRGGDGAGQGQVVGQYCPCAYSPMLAALLLGPPLEVECAGEMYTGM